MKKILVIDDDIDLSDTIKSVLQYEGYFVFVANDGKDGINIAKEQKPDLILLDIMMPGMDGTEAVKILKSEPQIRDIPIIFLTGLIANHDKNYGLECINIGGKEFKSIGKPFDNKRLLEIVKTTLKNIR